MKEGRWLGLVTVGERTIPDVRGVRVDGDCDDDGCTYRLELRTGQGDVPLTLAHTRGWKSKEAKAAQINAYVRQGGGEPLEVREGHALQGLVYGCVLPRLMLHCV